MQVNPQPSAKRDPLKRQPLAQPGDSTHDQLSGVFEQEVERWLLACVVCAAIAIGQWIMFLSAKPPHPIITTVIAAILAIILAIRLPGARRTANNLRLGIRGESAVGQQLETLRALGYHVFHDLPGNGFNVDHVLIGPAGLFVIETKTRSKPARGRATITYDGRRVFVNGHAPDRDPIAQARANRDHVCGVLAKFLKERPTGRAVVVFPGWWVERTARDPEVWVLNDEAFLKIIGREPPKLSEDTIRILAESLETHLRAKRS